MTRSWKVTAGMCAVLAAAVGPVSAEVDQAKVAQALKAVLAWDYGKGSGELQYLAGLAVQAGKDAALRKDLEGRIIAALNSPGTNAGKGFLCRQLVIVGTQKCVPALAKLLTDKDLSHMSRYALERIPGPAADEALRKALGQVDDRLKVGMIYSLGRRGDEAAVDRLIPLLGSKNEEVLTASLVALSRIATDKAVQAVAQARGTARGKLRPVATNAYLDCAARLARQGKKAEAAAIYTKLYQPGESSMCRVAALRIVLIRRRW